MKDEHGREYVLRYVITQLDKEPGWRCLATAQQGRNTWATQEEAEGHMSAIMANNSQSTLESVYRLPLKVLPSKCYPRHFDPMQCYFQDEEG